MISALSGSSALSLLSMFGRSETVSGSSPPPAASRPPSPPPPTSQGNGASAQSLFDALVSGDGSDGLSAMMAELDQDGDGALNAEEMTQAFANQSVQTDGLSELVSNILSNLDTDGSASVSAEELSTGLQGLAANGPPPGGPPPGGPPPGGPPPGSASGASASDQANSLISALDTDGDGQLGAEELTAAFGASDSTSASGEAESQKSIQELLFNLLLDQKDQNGAGQTALASALYGG